jgi:excisionase family DNA binding protein
MIDLTFTMQLTPEMVAALRVAFMLSPAEIESIAAATVRQMREQNVQASQSLTVVEFAKQARLSVSGVYNLIKQGRLDAMTPLGGDIRISAAAADKYFTGGKHGNAG